MKTLLTISCLFLLSCTMETAEPQLVLRGDYITYSQMPACTGQEVTVTFDNGYGNNCGTSRLQQFINGNWITVVEAEPEDGIITYSFIPAAPGAYRFRASWNKSGKNCDGDNIRPFEEDPLEVVEDCCRDYFTVTSICDESRDCLYGLEIHLMTTMENWISITGQLPEGYNFCGLYDENGNIIYDHAGNVIEIVGDFFPCFDVKFYVYFSAPVELPSFGVWTVMDMHEMLYKVEPEPCGWRQAEGSY